MSTLALLRDRFRSWRAAQNLFNSDSARRRQIFCNIYNQKTWGDGESASGPGSGVERAALFRPDLEALIHKLGVRSLLDAPCGDFNWLPHVDLQLERYIGIDIVPAMVARNRARYATGNRTFLVRDMVSDRLPKVDLIFCRDGLVHLSNREIWQTLGNFQRSGATWLMTNTFVDHHDNQDIPTGGWQPLNLQDGPFNLPAPVEMIDEKCFGYDGVYRDKRLGIWQLQDIRCGG
jgi:methyltransferase family protein